MRRKKDEFKDVRDHMAQIMDAEQLREYFDSLFEVFAGAQLAEVAKIYEARKKELERCGALVVCETKEQDDESIEVEEEVVDDEPIEVEHAEMKLEVALAYKDFEARSKEAYEKFKKICSRINDVSETLKGLKADKESVLLEMANLCANGHEQFVKQPTLFDNLGEYNEAEL